MKIDEILLEVELYSHIKKNSRLSDVIGKKVNRHANYTGFKLLGNLPNGQEVYQRNRASGNTDFVVSDESNTVVAALNADRRGKSYHVNVAQAGAGSPGMHRLYNYLITKQNIILTTDKQSPGGQAIWQKLAQMPGVAVHGWYRGKPVNIDMQNSLETHSSYDDIEQAEDDEDHPKDVKDMQRVKDMKLVAYKKY